MFVAEIAQSVEHFTRNEGVVGSSPIFSLTEKLSPQLWVIVFLLIVYTVSQQTRNTSK